ncbi:methyltransferase domain-containing protein [Vogesella sp. GCM10023246]|uniref:Methyltransferase domain-containing protein n=1 Tax=Vogesella oryzagri TaxID=3160864 RepID=A0ABV1M6D6_9NEIS
MAVNSGDAAFWDIRYQQHSMPWDSAGLPGGFAGEAQRLLAAGARRVLVPGCGSAYEVEALLQHGAQVLAVDFSAPAVARARALHPQCADAIVEADFFSAAVSGEWDWVYERAFLCALPPALRPQYAAKMAALLPAGSCLAGYFYLGDKRGGPPYTIATDSLQALLGPYFTLEQQLQLPGSLPVFGQDEYWMVWRRTQET